MFDAARKGQRPPPLASRRGSARRQGEAALADALAHLVLVLLEARRLPELEAAADADKGHLVADSGVVDQPLRENDAAFAVERQLIRFGQNGAERIAFVREFGQRVEAFGDLFQPVMAAGLEGANGASTSSPLTIPIT